MDKIAIIGAGGAAKDVFSIVEALYVGKNLADWVTFYEEDEYFEKRKNGFLFNCKINPLSNLNFNTCKVNIAIGDGNVRKKIVGLLPKNTEYINLIHPTASVGRHVKIGKSISIAQFTSITINTVIEDFCIINAHNAIAHDCYLSEYTTTSPGVLINGHCNIGKNVFLGSGAVIRDKTTIGNNVVIGMGAIVTKDINNPGVYIGNPALRIR